MDRGAQCRDARGAERRALRGGPAHRRSTCSTPTTAFRASGGAAPMSTISGRTPTHPKGLWRRTTLADYRKPAPAWDVLLDVDALARHEGEDWVWGGCTALPPDFPARAGAALARRRRRGRDPRVRYRRQVLRGGRIRAAGGEDRRPPGWTRTACWWPRRSAATPSRPSPAMRAPSGGGGAARRIDAAPVVFEGEPRGCPRVRLARARGAAAAQRSSRARSTSSTRRSSSSRTGRRTPPRRADRRLRVGVPRPA